MTTLSPTRGPRLVRPALEHHRPARLDALDFLPAAIFALTRLPPATKGQAEDLSLVGLVGLLLACVAAFRWAAVAGKNGYSGILHLIVPLCTPSFGRCRTGTSCADRP
jgi:hypothetical protein